MRVTGLVLVLILLSLVPTPTAAQSGAPLAYPLESGTPAVTKSLDLQDSTVTAVRFTLRQSDFTSLNGVTLQAVLVRLARTGSADSLEVSLQSPAAQGGGATDWVGLLPATTPDLVKGTWTLQVTIVDNGAGTAPLDSRARSLSVLATDTTAPVIRVSGASTDGKVFLGPGDVLAVLPEDALLRALTYRLPATGTLPLAFPYLISLPAFKEGTQTVTLNATDRAGNNATRAITVIVDTAAPQLTVALPASLYLNVASDIVVISVDANAHNVTFRVGTNLTASPSSGPSKSHSFAVKPTSVGSFAFSVRATDRLGNTAERSFSVNSTVVTTDTVVESLGLSVAHPVIGEAVSVRATVAQASGVLPLDLSVNATGALVASKTATVDGPGSAVVDFPVKLAAGRHNVTVTVGAPAFATETHLTNQAKSLHFEVFFGKVEDNASTYYIRAGPFGLPSHAVTVNDVATPLTLVQKGFGVSYEFKVAGNRTLVWDPQGPSTTATSSSSSSSTSDAPAKKSPAPVAAFIAIGLLALAARRRR